MKAKTPKRKRSTLKDLAAKAAGNVKGGIIAVLIGLRSSQSPKFDQ